MASKLKMVTSDHIKYKPIDSKGLSSDQHFGSIPSCTIDEVNGDEDVECNTLGTLSLMHPFLLG